MQPEDLTPRQLDVLALAAQGYTNAEIAERLWLTPETVKGHLAQINWRLDARNRAHAVAIALEQGWIEMPPIGGSA